MPCMGSADNVLCPHPHVGHGQLFHRHTIQIVCCYVKGRVSSRGLCIDQQMKALVSEHGSIDRFRLYLNEFA